MSNKYFEATLNYFYRNLGRFNLFDAWPEHQLLAYVDDDDGAHVVFVTVLRHAINVPVITRR